MPTQDVRKIIEDRGGFQAVANALSARRGRRVRRSTIHSWLRNDSIPWWHVVDVLAIPKQSKAKKRKAAA